MSLGERIKRTAGQIAKAISGQPAEGEYRPGPWYLPVTHGWLPADVGQSLGRFALRHLR